MSVKLQFLDRSRTRLHEEDISHEWLAPLPMKHEIVTLPSGQRVRIIGREIAYVTNGLATETTILFECELLR